MEVGGMLPLFSSVIELKLTSAGYAAPSSLVLLGLNFSCFLFFFSILANLHFNIKSVPIITEFDINSVNIGLNYSLLRNMKSYLTSTLKVFPFNFS